MKAGIIEFPGSGGVQALAEVLHSAGYEAVPVWHAAEELPDVDAVYLPQGASYGDHPRPGALAACSRIMAAVAAAAAEGLPVLGIGNGFQVLTEAGLLPGQLLVNECLHFVCRRTQIVAGEGTSVWLNGLAAGESLELPAAHAYGRWTAAPETVNGLERDGRIAFRYRNGNPSGSLEDVAGVLNERGNVLGLMPLPERAGSALLGGTDGLKLILAPLTGGAA